VKDVSKLLKEVEFYYQKEGRSHLPWRKTKDPYKILVSEVMLQQTQVDRVLPFYKNFLKQFPTPAALAKAPLSNVLKAWQGLGYNRRAKFLQQAAVVLAKEGYTGQKLPGVGPYTQGAIDAFALNKQSVIIETNIRTVFTHFCFNNSTMIYHSAVSDAEILPLIQKALKKTNLEPREFYAALMDYGSYLKKQGIKLNKQSKHYVKQSKFEGSARQLRGAILRELLKKPQTTSQLTKNLSQHLTKSAKEVSRELERLQKEGLVCERKSSWSVR
jgi:A/G-specific adenine glycosylase